jgi:hypothetical protein
MTTPTMVSFRSPLKKLSRPSTEKMRLKPEAGEIF